ncbi:hypothetical protein [uncultured Microbacterium sp.]|uniref:hypothetical protein n=1 Tax=uncultured Microbacterium sp. TaxID=191216 RepID=UPI0028DD10AA|nr:hypothetical protein [uncultured Microbacterium sp.]
MNTTLSHSIPHPPDTKGREVLDIPAPEELRALSLADRLGFRIGLWLLRRAQRPAASRRWSSSYTSPLSLAEQQLSPREMQTILAFHLQRQLH